LEDADSARFEATAAIGEDWHFVDTMGSVVIDSGRVLLRRRDGEVIVEAPVGEASAKKYLGAVRIWIKGGRYSIEAPKKRVGSLGGRRRKPETQDLTRRFLQAFADQGGHLVV
jgi:hypothetical protein